MKKFLKFLLPGVIAFVLVYGCKKDNNNQQSGEVWPKEGYMLTTDDSGDTVYVEAGTFAVTSPYLSNYPLSGTEKKWRIFLPSSGEGVMIHNEDNDYWTIDSTFHPGLNVEQHYVDLRTSNDPSSLSDFYRWKFHKDPGSDAFYLESVRFPGAYVTALGHAESGRGLRLRTQSAGSWKFWLQQQ